MSDEKTGNAGDQGAKQGQEAGQGQGDGQQGAGAGENQQGNQGDGQQGGDGKQKMVPHQALHEEREARKAAETELKKLRDAEAKRNEEKMKENNQFKELSEQKDRELAEALSKLTDTETRLKAYEDGATERIKSQLETITKPEDKVFAENLLKGKSLADQESLLPSLLERLGSPKNINANPQGGDSQTAGKTKATVEQLQTEMETAIKGGDTRKAMKLQRAIEELKGAGK